MEGTLMRQACFSFSDLGHREVRDCSSRSLSHRVLGQNIVNVRSGLSEFAVVCENRAPSCLLTAPRIQKY